MCSLGTACQISKRDKLHACSHLLGFRVPLCRNQRCTERDNYSVHTSFFTQGMLMTSQVQAQRDEAGKGGAAHAGRVHGGFQRLGSISDCHSCLHCSQHVRCSGDGQASKLHFHQRTCCTKLQLVTDLRLPTDVLQC